MRSGSPPGCGRESMVSDSRPHRGRRIAIPISAPSEPAVRAAGWRGTGERVWRRTFGGATVARRFEGAGDMTTHQQEWGAVAGWGHGTRGGLTAGIDGLLRRSGHAAEAEAYVPVVSFLRRAREVSAGGDERGAVALLRLAAEVAEPAVSVADSITALIPA